MTEIFYGSLTLTSSENFQSTNHVRAEWMHNGAKAIFLRLYFKIIFSIEFWDFQINTHVRIVYRKAMIVGKAICIPSRNFEKNSLFRICQQTRWCINSSIIPVCKSKWEWNSLSFPIGIPVGKADGSNICLKLYTTISKKSIWLQCEMITYLCKKESEDGKQTEFSSGKGED